MDKCNAKHLLQSKNMKITPTRLAVLEEILRHSSPVNANSLHSSVKRKLALDLVTVYRICHALVKNRLLREVFDHNGTQHFEAACVHKPVHPHFTCEQCQKIFCLDHIGFDESVQIMRVAPQFFVRDISIRLSGICEQCQKHPKGSYGVVR